VVNLTNGLVRLYYRHPIQHKLQEIETPQNIICFVRYCQQAGIGIPIMAM
jgi:hypothetical protein